MTCSEITPDHIVNLEPNKSVARAPLPRNAALPEMATAVLIMDEDRRVEYVNTSADMLFKPINAIGCTLQALFASCGASGAEEVFTLVDAGDNPSPVRVRLGDDLQLDCTMRLLSSGGFVVTLDDVTELVRNAELARRDALTGLANRASLRDHLVERLQAAARSEQSIAVLYIDLDRFKAVNDTLGHPIGDLLLRKVADRFRSALRDGDFVARIGGDEFAVIQSAAAVQPEAAMSLATRLVDLIGRAYAVEGHMLHIGASVGVTMFPNDGCDPGHIVQRALVQILD